MRGRRTATSPAARPDVAPATWPPLLVIHGGVDPVVSARNGQAAVQLWADASGANAGPARSVQRGKRYQMTVTDFTRDHSIVATLVEVGQLGHAWSGGAANQPFSDEQGPDASRMAWAFASRQFDG
jgi:acetyl esterase/lipase